jgi:BMFP domain-containing protein YqiC
MHRKGAQFPGTASRWSMHNAEADAEGTAYRRQGNTVDRNIIDQLASKLTEAVPGDLRTLRADLENNFRSLLQTTLGKLELVTREEFEVQRKVLERTREKLERLEKALAEMQQSAGGQTGGKDPQDR